MLYGAACFARFECIGKHDDTGAKIDGWLYIYIHIAYTMWLC